MIRLTNNIAVSADSNQYIVGRPTERRDKGGEPATEIRNPCYYTTLAAALKSAVAQSIREGVASGQITTLRDYMDELRRMQEDFAQQLEPLDI